MAERTNVSHKQHQMGVINYNKGKLCTDCDTTGAGINMSATHSTEI